MAASVLVTDGEERAALAAVRSLGRAGHDVSVTSSTGRSVAGASRYSGRTWETPDPLAEPDDFCATVGRIVGSNSIDVLLPVTEASLSTLLPRRSRLGEVVIPFPPYARFRAITNKSEVMKAARNVGIAVPRQATLEAPGREAREPPPGLEFPLVLKPARSIGEAADGRAKVGVTHVTTPEAYRNTFEALPAQAFPLLVQERIQGTGAGVFLLVRKDEVLASFAHRRIREKPPSGGVSVCRESVAVDPDLLEASRKLLSHFRWDGVAMVEFKIADETGEAYLMEINPRLWGSLQLAVDAGVDFPRLCVESALGEEIEPVRDYELGVRTRWWWGEVDHLIARVKAQSNSTGVAAGIREFFSASSDLLEGWRTTRSEVWSWSDPAPFLRETTDWFRRI